MREEGIHPMAINSLLAKLGTSQPVELCLEHKTLIKGFELKTLVERHLNLIFKS